MSATTAPLLAISEASGFAAEVAAGLSDRRKRLPSRYFYDEVGSALFEAITALPEYGLTRADERLIRRHAGDIAAFAGRRARIAELGSGSGRKTRWILEAFSRPQYHPIDVSPAALDQCRKELGGSARIQEFAGTYEEGLSRVVAARTTGEPLLVLFLGSTVGNFDREEALSFLRRLRAILRQGDHMLIGFDLVKHRDALLAAYDDAAGVTAAFNRNLLSRINRELGADFDPRAFAHEARYLEPVERVEMHLASSRAQSVFIEALGRHFEFERGETIWTESSHKYRSEDIRTMALDCGFKERVQWVDSEWPFAESLWGVL